MTDEITDKQLKVEIFGAIRKDHEKQRLLLKITVES
jgi:hypothetical protein